MKILIYTFTNDITNSVADHLHLPGDYDDNGAVYEDIDDFYDIYLKNSLSRIAYITDKRDSIKKIRESQAELRKFGYYPDFEDEEIAFLLFNNLLIYNAWQSKYKLTNQLLYTWLREFTKAGIKDVCNNLGRYPLDKYLEENSKEIGKDYAYVRHDSFWEN